MPLVYCDEDPWLRESESCRALCAETAARLESGAASADVRLRLRQADQQLTQLRSMLNQEDPDHLITGEERERRTRELEELSDRVRHLRVRHATPPAAIGAPPSDPNRSQLFNEDAQPTPIGKTHTAGDVEALFDMEASRKRQAQLLSDQERGLDVLSQVISRQRDIADNIGNEVTSQTQLISDLTDHIVHADGRAERATQRTAQLITHDNTCGYWCVIVALLVAIVLVVVL